MKYEALADRMVKAISAMAENEDNLDNFRSYLTYSFGEWLEHFCKTPEGMVEEFETFGYMYCEEEERIKYLDDMDEDELRDILHEHDELLHTFSSFMVESTMDEIVHLLGDHPYGIDWEVDGGRETVTIRCKHYETSFSNDLEIVNWLDKLDRDHYVLLTENWDEEKSKLKRYLSALTNYKAYIKDKDYDYMAEYVEKTIDSALKEAADSLETMFEDAEDFDNVLETAMINDWFSGYYLEDGELYEYTKDRKVA